jgi:FG-GAP-like repeat
MTGDIFKSVGTCKQAFVLGLLALTTLGAKASTFAVKPAQNYSVGTNPRAVATGDFNGDGKMDLAVVNFGDPSASDDGNISILLGNGDGTFQTAKNVAAGKNCAGIVAGDFDGDGKDDVALVRQGNASMNDNGDVSLFLGNGDGTFHPGQVLTPGKNPAAALADDLDGDGKLDLVVSNTTDKSVAVLMGNGDGTFKSPVAYTTTLPPGSLMLVDFDQDGKKDLAVFRALGVDFLLGNGDGTFRQGPTARAGVISGGFPAAGDFNDDGKLDLVKESCSFLPPHSCGRSLLLGNGDGTFQSPITLIQPVNGAADFDGDGKLDLAGITPNSGSAQVQISVGNGDGTFQPPVSFDAGASAVILALVGDIDGDHSPDLVLLDFDSSGFSSNSISVLMNTGTDFSLSASQPSSPMLTRGQSANSTLTLDLLSNFKNPVSLSCSVQPTQARSPACSITPNSVTFDADGKATAQMTITAGTGAASLTRPPFEMDSLPLYGLWLPVASFALMRSRLGHGESRKRKRLGSLAGVGLFTALILQTACGGGSGSGPKSQSYTVTVTATSGSTKHITLMSISVR